MDGSALLSFASALGIGLLLGIERERSQRLSHPDRETAAGVRSFAVAALSGSLTALFGNVVIAVGLLGVILFALIGYLRTSQQQPGMTTELALIAAYLLGSLCHTKPALAAAVAVTLSLLLLAKSEIHQFSREWISEQEMRDGLLLAAAALVVLPMMPDREIDPWKLFNPGRIWLLVVLIMAISSLGHFVLRLIGARRGLPLAGFFAGFVSSTAAVAGFGERARSAPEQLRPSVAAAMLANLASLLLFMPITWAVSERALQLAVVPIGAAAMVLLIGGLLGLSLQGAAGPAMPTAEQRMFRFRHALLLALFIGLITAGANLVHRAFGAGASVLATTLAAAAELHASAASLAQLFDQGSLESAWYSHGVVGLLLASAIAKSSLAWISGGAGYGLRVSAGMIAMCAAAALASFMVN